MKRIKILTSFIALPIITTPLLLTIACNKSVALTGIIIDQGESATVGVGETLRLTCTFKPADTTDKRVTWSSDDNTIVTVNQDGLVSGVAEGETTITVSSVSNPKICATCQIYVQEHNVTSVTIDNDFTYCTVGGTLQLMATVLPETATDKSLKWVAQDSTGQYLTVDDNGLVTGVSASGPITVEAKNLKSEERDSVQVHVVEGVKLQAGTGIKAWMPSLPILPEYETFGDVMADMPPLEEVELNSLDQGKSWDGKFYSNEACTTEIDPSTEFNSATTIYIKTVESKENYQIIEGRDHECRLIRCDEKDKQSKYSPPNSIKYNGQIYKVTEIGNNAFSRIQADDILIPNNVKKICANAFEGTYAKTIQFQKNSQLLEIDDGAFTYIKDDCPLESITFPQRLRKLGAGVFELSSKLKTINFGENSHLQEIGDHAFDECSSLSAITIPSDVTSIGDYAFNECSGLQTITFGQDSKLRSIGKNCFDGATAFSSITLPKSLRSIGEHAFEELTNLTSLTFEEGSLLRNIGAYAFYRTGITSLVLPDNVRTIGGSAFEECPIATLTISNDSQLSVIDNSAFEDCKFTTINLPKTLTKIGSRAFTSGNRYLATITYGGTKQEFEKVQKVDDWAFDISATVVQCTDGEWPIPGK